MIVICRKVINPVKLDKLENEVMYPVERYIKILKSYVENSHLPKAYIVKRYILEEAIKFCIGYMSAAESA
ncbi:hypothetical protein CR513_26277, partial [Mucuna pruriens]